MKNNFTIEVSFNEAPYYSYEWDDTAIISGIKLFRVDTKTIEDLLTYEGIIKTDNNMLLLSDCKTAIVLRLDDKGKIVKRSFLDFEHDVEICEYAMGIRGIKLNYELYGYKIKYSNHLSEEVNMKDFVVKSLKNISDEFENRYLYFLFFNEIEGYRKDKLLNYIAKDKPGNFQKLYDFLITK